MILVDSSVWIDFLRDRSTPQTAALTRFIQTEELVTADLVLTEVLQGTQTQRSFDDARRLLTIPEVMTISDRGVALEAARNYQRLRALGITVRKTIDTLIATRCILDSIPLLYCDRDFDPFVRHLGLRSGLDLPTGVP